MDEYLRMNADFYGTFAKDVFNRIFEKEFREIPKPLRETIVLLKNVDLSFHSESPEAIINESIEDRNAFSIAYKKLGTFKKLRRYLALYVLMMFKLNFDAQDIEDPGLTSLMNLYKELSQKFIGLKNMRILFDEQEALLQLENVNIFEGYLPNISDIRENAQELEKLEDPSDFSPKVPVASNSLTKKVLLIGLDSVGKTSILYMLKNGVTDTTTPTVGYNCESLYYSGYSIEFWDLGYGSSVWNHFASVNDAVVFVVDRNTLSSSVNQLTTFLEENTMYFNSSTPIAILANKQDTFNPVSTYELENSFYNVPGNKNFFATSVSGAGLYGFLDWIVGKWNETLNTEFDFQ